CYIYYMINLRGAPLLRPFLIFGFIGLCIVDSFSRINGYKNHWRDIWVGWLIGFFIAFFLCHCVLCFQEIYHMVIEKPAVVEERVSPVYEEDVPQTETMPRQRKSQDRQYEVTTTTESYHRTISPPQHNGYQY
ncbi:hypothetical protein TELCIR_19831, partial [Teladorsagia circumcincta]